MYLSENFSIYAPSPKWRNRVTRRHQPEERRRPENSHFRKHVDALWALIHARDRIWATDALCRLIAPGEFRQRITAYDQAAKEMHQSLMEMQRMLMRSTASSEEKHLPSPAQKKLESILICPHVG